MENNKDVRVIGFFRPREEYGEFSNFYKRNFNINGQNFCCVEQYFMYGKAVAMKDMDTAVMILRESEPKEIKRLGRRVRNYDEALWSSIRYNVMMEGLRAKFTQNEDLKRLLLNTGDHIIAECSPYDRIWGIGMSVYDRNIQNPGQWNGTNLLGKALMELRNELKG